MPFRFFCLCVPHWQPKTNPPRSLNFSVEYVGLTADQMASIESGKALAKVLDSESPDNVFVFGAVYVESTPEQYLNLHLTSIDCVSSPIIWGFGSLVILPRSPTWMVLFGTR